MAKKLTWPQLIFLRRMPMRQGELNDLAGSGSRRRTVKSLFDNGLVRWNENAPAPEVVVTDAGRAAMADHPSVRGHQKPSKRIITIKLTKAEAEGLMDALCRGIEDMIDTQDDDTLDMVQPAKDAGNKLGMAMEAAWPTPDDDQPVVG